MQPHIHTHHTHHTYTHTAHSTRAHQRVFCPKMLTVLGLRNPLNQVTMTQLHSKKKGACLLTRWRQGNKRVHPPPPQGSLQCGGPGSCLLLSRHLESHTGFWPQSSYLLKKCLDSGDKSIKRQRDSPRRSRRAVAAAGVGLWGLVVLPPDGDRLASSPLPNLGITSRPGAPPHQQGGRRSEGLGEGFHGASAVFRASSFPCCFASPPASLNLNLQLRKRSRNL